MVHPKTASMAPFPTGTAFCIANPFLLIKKSASLKLKEFEHTKAEYSPNECPAKNLNNFGFILSLV